MNDKSQTPAPSPILIVRQLHKSYRGQNNETVEVLKGINVEVNKGEVVAIIGSSGSGKTTLLSLLAGLDHATTGEIICAGTIMSGMGDSNKMPSEDDLARFRAKHIGIVFQRFHLMPHLCALENIRLPLDILNNTPAHVRDNMARQALEQVRLSHRANHFPAQLSGGECQRVAIARAIITQPSIILADEPTGNLDEDHAQLVADMLFEAARAMNTALIIVTHNMDLGRRCHRMLKLHGGRFV